MTAPLVIGVDVGGTRIRAGLVDREGTVLARKELESPEREEEVVAALDGAVADLLDERVGALGYGVPANLDRRTGRILRATNLPLDDFDLRGHAAARFGLPAGVENDANAAALAEWKLGAGRGASTLVMLTLGTGVGGGLVLDGRPYRGWAEIGHVVVRAGGPPCQGACHGRGHLEALASGTAADRAARELYGPDADARLLVERARAGEAEALARLHELADVLGAAIGSLANLFDPDLVVVGGGFGEGAAELLLPRAQEAARREALAPADARLRIVPAELGVDAGLVGAALVGFEALDGAW
ncbi:MAG TPA: ROK family protein [Thermodesulfobacteriota bacterium]|nr:ROK family protein [Thermodesulfobacteriota bacterium]